jgi:predicted CopG family antitoxin
MIRKTIILEDEVYEALQKFRAEMLMVGKDISFNAAVNALLFNGIIEAQDMSGERWKELRGFQSAHDEFSEEIDKHIEQMLKRMKKIIGEF